MPVTDPYAEVAAFTDAKRTASLTGRLLGLGLPERDEVLAAEFARFDAAIAAATARAAQEGRPVAVDGAGVSLTDGGDTWMVWPDGRMTREYSRYEGFEAFLAQLAHPPAVDFHRAPPRGMLLEAAYHAFWSPSATNWQPTRVLEVTGETRDALAAIAGFEVPSNDFPLLLLLRREHYESLLGDVLEPFGQEVTAREESIDAGIFAHTLAMSALAQGFTAREHEFGPAEREAARPIVIAEIDQRLASPGAQDARVRASLVGVREFLASGRYHPDAILAVGHPTSPVTPYPAFGRLVGEHSTQRVASPAAEFGHDAMMRIWEVSRDTLPVDDRDLVQFADFSWHERVPARIGQAMFEALYGPGADPDTKAGGEGGLLTAINASNYLRHADKTSSAWLDERLPPGWRDLDEEALRKASRELPFRRQDLGRYMLERILRDGKYRVDGDVVLDDRDRPLTVMLLVRMFKSLAATFGNFFLKFQNTHPQNAVLLADATHRDPHHAWRAVGKAAAVLTYLSRAQGASSIIKTGPIDLARDPIGAILAENPDDLPHLRPWKERLLRRELLPAMTFQVGLPLAGSDVIEAGTPGEHTGYEERRRDKRPPRENFTAHYFPAG